MGIMPEQILARLQAAATILSEASAEEDYLLCITALADLEVGAQVTSDKLRDRMGETLDLAIVTGYDHKEALNAYNTRLLLKGIDVHVLDPE